MFEFIYDYFPKDDVTKYIRLIIAVGVYLFIRKYYSQWAQNKQQQRQLAIDAEEKAAKPEKDRKEKELVEEKIERENDFGWGKKTRSREKRKQAIVEQIANEERLRYQSAYDAAADHDIEYLLED